MPEMTWNQKLGAGIRRQRRALRMTQWHVAKKLGYQDESTVSCWENGYFTPNAANLYRLADVLSCSIDAFYCFLSPETV